MSLCGDVIEAPLDDERAPGRAAGYPRVDRRGSRLPSLWRESPIRAAFAGRDSTRDHKAVDVDDGTPARFAEVGETKREIDG